MDLILDKKDITKTATQLWHLKWVPAVLGYAKSLKTKSVATAIEEFEKKLLRYVHITHYYATMQTLMQLSSCR